MGSLCSIFFTLTDIKFVVQTLFFCVYFGFSFSENKCDKIHSPLFELFNYYLQTFQLPPCEVPQQGETEPQGKHKHHTRDAHYLVEGQGGGVQRGGGRDKERGGGGCGGSSSSSSGGRGGDVVQFLKEERK